MEQEIQQLQQNNAVFDPAQEFTQEDIDTITAQIENEAREQQWRQALENQETFEANVRQRMRADRRAINDLSREDADEPEQFEDLMRRRERQRMQRERNLAPVREWFRRGMMPDINQRGDEPEELANINLRRRGRDEEIAFRRTTRPRLDDTGEQVTTPREENPPPQQRNTRRRIQPVPIQNNNEAAQQRERNLRRGELLRQVTDSFVMAAEQGLFPPPFVSEFGEELNQRFLDSLMFERERILELRERAVTGDTGAVTELSQTFFGPRARN